MNQSRRMLGLGAVFAIASVLAAQAAIDVVPWRQLSDRNVSPLGRRLMRGNTRAWFHAESDHLIIHAAQEPLLSESAHEAQWCLMEIGRWLDLPALEKPVRVFVVKSSHDWARVMQAATHGGDGVAAHLAGEVFIRRVPDEEKRYVDLAHELVHARLYLAFGDRIPLWLDEGLAEYLGWRVAAAYYRQHRELHLVQEPAPVDEAQWMTWEQFFELRDYPDDPERNRIFYRQSYQVIRFLVERLGEEHLGPFVRQVIAGGQSAEQLLRDEWGWETVDWDEALTN